MKHIENYTAIKNISGVAFNAGKAELIRFAKHCAPYLTDELSITKDVVQKWVAPTVHESPNTRKIRVNYVVAFLKYLASQGVSVYMAQPIRQSLLPYIPYIYTNEELAKFFTAADNAKNKPHKKGMFSNRPLIMSVIFKLIYGCGLRVSEATSLRVGDVDLERGVMTIMQSKLDKERLVPVHATLLATLREYSSKVHASSKPGSPFFPSPKGNGHYSQTGIYVAFRDHLWEARISHGGKGRGPRVHDFRHTFAVHCLRNWVLGGADLMVALPYLSAYMGHSSIASSQYYLRLTAEMYPDIVMKMKHSFDVMPDLEVLYETN